jgi:hypothetical protein
MPGEPPARQITVQQQPARPWDAGRPETEPRVWTLCHRPAERSIRWATVGWIIDVARSRHTNPARRPIDMNVDRYKRRSV